uniref:GATA zinc finger domain-containing protein 14-like n=1 Tax=Dermatophagoides pteronyssinus TaxID=6956 RepID=A0A6P6Y707_DERPT
MKFKNKNPSIDHPSHKQQTTLFNDNNPMNIDNNHGHHHPKHSKQKNKSMNIIKDNDGHNVITKCDPSSLSSKSSSKTTKKDSNRCHSNIILKQRYQIRNQEETRMEQQQEEKNQKFSICNNIHGDDDKAQNNKGKTVPKTSSDSSKIDDTGTEKIKSPRSRSRQRTNVPHHDKQYLNQKQISPSSSSNKTNRHSLNNNSRKIDDFCHDNHCQQNNDDHQKQQSTDIDHKQSISSTTTKCLTKKKSKNKMIDNEINPAEADFDCNNQYVDQPQQHEPLSQVLVTLKSQNQNLIKEVEDLRIKLEDAEGDLKLVQCQMRQISKQQLDKSNHQKIQLDLNQQINCKLQEQQQQQ